MFSKLKKVKGAAAIEFAMLLPVLILIVFGIITFGFAYADYILLTHAARDGARLAAIGKDYDYISEQIEGFEKDLPEPQKIIESIEIDPLNPTDRVIGEPVKVTVTGKVLDAPFMKILKINPIKLISTAEMRVEYNKPDYNPEE